MASSSSIRLQQWEINPARLVKVGTIIAEHLRSGDVHKFALKLLGSERQAKIALDEISDLVVLQVLGILSKWTAKCGCVATWDTLCSTLVKMEREDVAKSLRDFLQGNNPDMENCDLQHCTHILVGIGFSLRTSELNHMGLLLLGSHAAVQNAKVDILPTQNISNGEKVHRVLHEWMTKYPQGRGQDIIDVLEFCERRDIIALLQQEAESIMTNS